MLYNADKSLAPVTEHHVISVLSQPGNEPPAPKFYGFLRTPRWNSCFLLDNWRNISRVLLSEQVSKQLGGSQLLSAHRVFNFNSLVFK